MKRLFIFYSAIALILICCSTENELKQSEMVYDNEFTDLPAYSEWGYNTFGAYYDREIFVSNNTYVPAKVVMSNDGMSFVLDGQKGSSNYYGSARNEMTMTFKISGFTLDNYSNLILFNDTVFELTNPAYQVSIAIDTTDYDVKIISGELSFKRAQNLLVDKKSVEVILSGLFDFKALINHKPMTISEGRFDVGIGDDNFYVY
jgi:hypothetical protein